MLFGWRHVGTTHTERKRFGFYLETFSTGTWLNLYWGSRSWAFTRYTKNRHTGPESNRSVLGHFFRGPDRRSKDAFSHAFKEVALKPIPSAFHNTYADDCHCRMCLASPAAKALLSKRYAER